MLDIEAILFFLLTWALASLPFSLLIGCVIHHGS